FQCYLHLARAIRLIRDNAELVAVQIRVTHTEDRPVQHVESFASDVDPAVLSKAEALRETDVFILIPESANLWIETGRVAEHMGRLAGELRSGFQESVDVGIELVPRDRAAPVIIAIDDRTVFAIEKG